MNNTLNTIQWVDKIVNRSISNPHRLVLGDLYTKYRCEKSYFGYDLSVLKSGIQKYARRAEVKKGLWCLIEMDLFRLLERNGPALEAYLQNHLNTGWRL